MTCTESENCKILHPLIQSLLSVSRQNLLRFLHLNVWARVAAATGSCQQGLWGEFGERVEGLGHLEEVGGVGGGEGGVGGPPPLVLPILENTLSDGVGARTKQRYLPRSFLGGFFDQAAAVGVVRGLLVVVIDLRKIKRMVHCRDEVSQCRFVLGRPNG